MKKSSLLALAALGITQASDALASGGRPNQEKCYGVAKKGKNMCATKVHACGGKSKVDGQTDEWIYVPKGLCEKLVGGSLVSKPHVFKKTKKAKK